MKMFRHAFAVVGFGVAALSFGQGAEFVAGEVVVKFVPGYGNALNNQIGASVKKYNATLGVTTVKLPANMSVSQAVSFYGSKVGVTYAEPNFIYRPTWVPNDPKFSQQYGPQKIQCVPAWDVMKGSPAIKIAVLDTGVDYTHEDLAGKMLLGKDFIDNDDDPQDSDGHGTHCAGNILAWTNNAKGIAGIAPNCSLLAGRVLGPGGGTADGVAQGITWAADNGANVISMSLGGGGDAQVMHDAVKYALNMKGVVVIAAAGNNGSTSPFYPAFYPECIAVAATDSGDNKAGFSNYGDWVDVAAPGVNILSTFPGNAYGAISGTSMACPIVAGLAGLIKSAWPAASAAQIRAQIENTCDNVGNFVIKGRVNAFKAIPTQFLNDPYLVAPTLMQMYEGTQAYNTTNQAKVSDNTYYAVSSKFYNQLGHVASTKGTFVITKDVATLQQLKFKVEASAASYVTGSLFIWNVQTNSWQYVGSSPLTGADSVKEFSIAAPYARYFDATKKCLVLYRAIMPISASRPPVQFPLRIDLIQLKALVPK